MKQFLKKALAFIILLLGAAVLFATTGEARDVWEDLNG